MTNVEKKNQAQSASIVSLTAEGAALETRVAELEALHEPEYGCDKPVTTSTLENFAIYGGQGSESHDMTFSRVRFVGDVTGVGSHATTGMLVSDSHPGEIHDIVYDRCVFATDLYPSAPSNAFHMILGSGRIYNILFRDCWFEPYSRLGIELNGRGGWWHDFIFERCTVEAGLGEMFSCDMSPDLNMSSPPHGATVDGVVRGVEGLHVRNCLLEGTGRPSVNGFTEPRPGYPTSWRKGLELASIYPYAKDNTVGRSEFIGNKVGKCYSSWMQTNYGGAAWMTFRDNLWDGTYNPHGCPGKQTRLFDGVSANHCTFEDNVYILPAHALSSVYGDLTETNSRDNVCRRERWSKPSGSLASAAFPYGLGSVYEDCDYDLPRAIAFSAQATGSGNRFNAYGYTGGDGSMV